ncbi:MAG: BolA/IbaG family iron-sulfur metabolism protein [Euryarchaeota archaeon]|nr:BolA/IbaG family iron-sulfur metabolism protein [Euryarchaeota archaeon]
MVEASFIIGLVHKALPEAEVHPEDMTGTGDHWHVVVVDPSFEGLRTFKRQRVVMEPFKAYIASDVVHALDLVTLTPDEFAARQKVET